ncbi:MAG: 30S ribosomal protein S17e [Candidatus Bathyarchaeia archaeon]
MGKVRPEKVKSIAHELIKRYPTKFTPSFEENKKIVISLANIPSSKLRNRIVGYITRLMALSQQS